MAGVLTGPEWGRAATAGAQVRIVLGLARYELAISARTAALWAVPILWVVLVAGAAQVSGGLQAALGGLAASAYGGVVGVFSALLAVALPGRTRAAAAQDVVQAAPAARLVASARTLAALVSAAALVVCALPAAAGYALLRAEPVAAFGPQVLPYLLMLLPPAWLGAAAGLWAGILCRDLRLAFVAVFVGAATSVLSLTANPGLPFGAFDAAGMGGSVSGGRWPFGQALAWHAVTLTGLAALLAVVPACRFRPRGRLRTVAVCAAAACVAAGLAGYRGVVAGFEVAPRPVAAAAPISAWRVTGMDVTLDFARQTRATVDIALRNAGHAPLTAVPLRLPTGLTLVGARIGKRTAVSTGGSVLRLPAPIPAGGTTEVTVTYGGRWTAFGTRSPLSLLRAAAPGRLVLTPAAGAGAWLPAIGSPTAFPLTLRLTGAVPPVTFCDLTPVAQDVWRGQTGGIACLGGHFVGTRSGSVEVWTAAPGPVAAAAARVLRAQVDALSGCLAVPSPPIGAVAVPAASWDGPWYQQFYLRRYGSAGPVEPVISGFSANIGLSWGEAGVIWGGGGTFPGDPTLRQDVPGLLAEAAARRAGLAAPALGAGTYRTAAGAASAYSSPGAQAVAQALQRLSPQAGCGLLASLRALDRRGQLTAAAVTSAVTRAERGGD